MDVVFFKIFFGVIGFLRCLVVRFLFVFEWVRVGIFFRVVFYG